MLESKLELVLDAFDLLIEKCKLNDNQERKDTSITLNSIKTFVDNLNNRCEILEKINYGGSAATKTISNKTIIKNKTITAVEPKRINQKSIMPQTPKPQSILQPKIKSSPAQTIENKNIPLISSSSFENDKINTDDRYVEIVLYSSKNDGSDEHIIQELTKNFNGIYEPRYMKTVISSVYSIKHKHDNSPYLHGLIRFNYNPCNTSHRVTENMSIKDNIIKTAKGSKNKRDYEKKFITVREGNKNITYKKDIEDKYNLIANGKEKGDLLDKFL